MPYTHLYDLPTVCALQRMIGVPVELLFVVLLQ